MSSWANQARSLRVPKFAEEAVGRARLAVVPRQRRRPAPRVPFVALVGIVLLGGVAGLLLFNTHMQKGSFHATALQQEATELHAREQQLRMELDALRDPQALAGKARDLGMVPADSPVFLDLATGKVIGEAKVSTAVNDFRFGAPGAAKPRALTPPPVILPREVVVANQEPSGAANPESSDAAGRKRSQQND